MNVPLVQVGVAVTEVTSRRAEYICRYSYGESQTSAPAAEELGSYTAPADSRMGSGNTPGPCSRWVNSTREARSSNQLPRLTGRCDCKLQLLLEEIKSAYTALANREKRGEREIYKIEADEKNETRKRQNGYSQPAWQLRRGSKQVEKSINMSMSTPRWLLSPQPVAAG